MRPTERPLKDTWRLVWCPLQPLSDQSRSQDETRWAAGQQTHKGLILVTVRTCDMLERWRCNQWCWCGVSEDRRLMLVMWRVQAGQTSSAWWILSQTERRRRRWFTSPRSRVCKVVVCVVGGRITNRTTLVWFGGSDLGGVLLHGTMGAVRKLAEGQRFNSEHEQEGESDSQLPELRDPQLLILRQTLFLD